MFLFGLVLGAESLPLPDFIKEAPCVLYVGSANKQGLCSEVLSKLLGTRGSFDHSQEPNAWTLDIVTSCVPSERHIQADARTVRLNRFMPLMPTLVVLELFPTASLPETEMVTPSANPHQDSLLMSDAIRNIALQMRGGSSLIIDTVPYFSIGILNPEFYHKNPFHGFFSTAAVVWAWHSLMEDILKKETKEWNICDAIQKQSGFMDDATAKLTIQQYNALRVALPLCTAQHSAENTTIATLRTYSSLIANMVKPEVFAQALQFDIALNCIFCDLVWLTRRKDMKDFLCGVGFKDIVFERGEGPNPPTGRRFSWIIKATKA